MNRKVDISHKTIVFITVFLLGLWVIYLIRDVIVLFFIAVILMSALSPMVEALNNLRIPKTISIALTYLMLIVILVALVSLVVTPLVEQIPNMILTLPHLVDRLIPAGVIDKAVLQQELTSFSKNALGFTLTIFSNMLGVISVAVLTFYLLLEKERVEKLMSQFFVNRAERARKLIERIEYKLGAWLRGQLLLTLMIGTSVYLVLFALNIPYALPLSILAGLMEVVPVIGPIISAIPAVLMAALISPVMALSVAGAFFAIQQLENHIIVPQLMKKVVGLNPLVVILAIAIGGRLLGVSGALLAVPITVVVQLIIEEVLNKDFA